MIASIGLSNITLGHTALRPSFHDVACVQNEFIPETELRKPVLTSVPAEGFQRSSRSRPSAQACRRQLGSRSAPELVGVATRIRLHARQVAWRGPDTPRRSWSSRHLVVLQQPLRENLAAWQ